MSSMTRPVPRARQSNTTDSIQQALLDFLVQNFMVEREEIVLDRSLVDEGIIDSFGLVEICAFLEREFCISIDEDSLTRENFGSVIRITHFVRELILESDHD